MRYLEIRGGKPLCGAAEIQGSKNAALPVLAAGMLGEGTSVIENCPDISDVKDLLVIMETLGCQIRREMHRVTIDAPAETGSKIKAEEARRIRSSVLFLGVLLGKIGKAVLPMPGGCEIGQRPIDIHIEALQCLGAEFSVLDLSGEENAASIKKTAGCTDTDCGRWILGHAVCLSGGNVHLRFPSVGATENVILAAVTARGETVIHNAAREPEIDELCNFLNLRGADIRREAGGDIRICGVEYLHSAAYRMRQDRIVAGTYLLAAAATRGRIEISPFPEEELEALLCILRKMGAKCFHFQDRFVMEAGGVQLPVPYLETEPYPGFPTDLQSQLMAVLCSVPGESCICEQIFENRFAVAEILGKMGAEIRIKDDCVYINGSTRLQAARVRTPDLRGGAALVIAGLQAEGCTVVENIEYIERGYEDISRDLRRLGADIWLREEKV